MLTRRASKDEILEMYLNDVPLGQRGSFAIFGVPEAARLFFGKDVSNLSRSPKRPRSPASSSRRRRSRRSTTRPLPRSPQRRPARDGRRGLHHGGRRRTRRRKEPLTIVQRALEAEAPYFVDYVGQTLAEDYPGLTTTTDAAVDVLHDARSAPAAPRAGRRAQRSDARRRAAGEAQAQGPAEAALIAVDPQTGEILALVGGRSYNQSQYNRAIVSRRQPGSVFKPFVYLTAFEQAARRGPHRHHAGLDRPRRSGDVRVRRPGVDAGELREDLRRPDHLPPRAGALAQPRDHPRRAGGGYDRVADFWKKLGVGNAPKPYPSIALGVFEATPFEIATAYTLFPNLGTIRPLQHILKITSGGEDVTKPRRRQPRRRAARNDVSSSPNMMRSVLNEGTAAGARSRRGFTLDAAGKTGTTNDLRDAWFVGFTPELLTVVWVGFDDNQPVGLTGAQAALPIWTQFMKRALAGHASLPFDVPDGITFRRHRRRHRQARHAHVPERPHRDAFIAGTEPVGGGQ